MTIIRTATNHVEAYEPEDGDVFVQVVWHGPNEDGRHLTNFLGTPVPVAQYQECVDWAVGMAEQMRFPLRVVPLRARDVFRPAEVLAALPHLSDQERGRLRAHIITAMAEVMVECPERSVRADARVVLTILGALPR